MAFDYAEYGLTPDLYAMPNPNDTIPGVTAVPGSDPNSNTSLDAFLEDGGLGDSKISSLTADKITAGTLQAGQTIYVGTNSLSLDGTNRQIIVNDGTYDIILIGFKAGFF